MGGEAKVVLWRSGAAKVVLLCVGGSMGVDFNLRSVAEKGIGLSR